MERNDGRVGLTAEGICKIIKTCKQCEVKFFSHEDIKVSFHASTMHSEVIPIDKPISMDEKLEALVEEQTMDQLEQDKRELDMAELLIEDPLRYEEMMANGEFENAENEY